MVYENQAEHVFAFHILVVDQMFCARLNPIHQHVPKRARVYVCEDGGKANYSWGLSWWFPSGSLARWIQALFYLPPPSFPFWIQNFISHKVGVKECLVSRLLSVCALWAIVWKACPSGLLMHVTLSCIFKCQQNM